MIKLCPQWCLRSMKEHLPAVVLGKGRSLFLLFHLPIFKWPDWKSSEKQRDFWQYFRCAPQFYLLQFHQIWRTQSSSGLTARLQLTSSDLHCLEMYSKVMSHGLLHLPYPGQMAHHPLCHHSQGFHRGQETDTWRTTEVLTTQYFETLKVAQNLLTTGHYIWSWSIPY